MGCSALKYKDGKPVALALLIAKNLIYIALAAMLGQAIVGALSWGRRHDNFVYQLFTILTKPVTRVVRLITPRLIVDQHIPALSFLVLVIGLFLVSTWHRDVCLADVTQAGCERWAQTWSESK
jgi:uncharacterized protein YggT (Ycf19 family)